MLQHIIDFDRHLFYLVNHDMTNPFFDKVMPWLRTPRNWIPLYVLISIFCLWKYRFWGLAIMIGIALSAGFADFTSASIIKPAVHRALTVLFVLVVLFVFGGDVIRGFSFALLIGVCFGTYSSICIATPVIIDFGKKNLN